MRFAGGHNGLQDLSQPSQHFVLGLAIAAGVATCADAQEAPSEQRYSVKADLESANAVNTVIARVGAPTETRLPPTLTPAALLEKLCGARAPRDYEIITREEDGETASYVRYQPCLKETPLRARVTPGDTLEAIAVRFGMRASSVDKLSVRTKEGDQKGGSKSDLAPGDFVVATKAPAWTSFATKPGAVQSRTDLIGMIAKEIQCGGEDPEACLTRRSILVVEEKPSHSHHKERISPIRPREIPSSPAAPAPTDRNNRADARPRLLGGPLEATAIAAAMLQPAPPAPTAETAPVADDQWPYDADLVARILMDAASQGPLTPRIFIGVAENGLGDKFGRPLSNAAFVGDTGDQPNSNGEDDDRNSYVDDWIGAGVLRGPEEIEPSGDVSLCPASGQVYSSWRAETLQRMSHGSVVASIAAGGRLRANAALTSLLPRLVFFRMAKKVCGDSDDDGSGAQDAIAATDYLILREAKVLNLSFFTDGSGGEVVRDRLLSLMRYDPPLLVMSAGNYISANLDQTEDCPACLGNPTRYSDVARLTLVVGSATRDRKIADYSGYGVQTVKIFAPGEPIGSVDLAGRPGDAIQPATSFSAPRVSFAGGLVQGLGVREIPRVRSRLLLSVWPLHPDSLAMSDGTGGILDLVKAAAVRHHAIEVVRPGVTGTLVRRTYVGQIVGGLAGACPGYAFNEAYVHAIRFGEADGDGSREARVTYRQVNPTTREPRTSLEQCQSTGTLRMIAIRDGQQDFSWADVRQVLFKAQYP